MGDLSFCGPSPEIEMGELDLVERNETIDVLVELNGVCFVPADVLDSVCGISLFGADANVNAVLAGLVGVL